jgi:hypothetical protein
MAKVYEGFVEMSKARANSTLLALALKAWISVLPLEDIFIEMSIDPRL